MNKSVRKEFAAILLWLKLLQVVLHQVPEVGHMVQITTGPAHSAVGHSPFWATQLNLQIGASATVLNHQTCEEIDIKINYKRQIVDTLELIIW